MRKAVFNLLMILALAVSFVPAAWALPRPVAAAEPAADDGPLTPMDREVPSRLQEVPEEVRELFADGMSAEAFVDLAGYTPRALEGMLEGDALMIIELEGDPVALQVAAREAQMRPMGLSALDGAIDRLEATQDQLRPQLTALGVQIQSNYVAVYNGFQARVPLDKLDDVRALPGVKAVHRAPVHEPALGKSVDLIGAYDVWQDLGVDGDGVTIAVIDTGIDYTHAALGGIGDPMAYSLNDPDVIEPNTFPTAKVVGGTDFVGTLYDAGCTAAEESAGICTATPQPDPDPLDEYSHGTHVSSIAAGIAAGDVMTGVAPAATLMALKVFGQAGSTTLTVDALEWATLQYLYTGKPEVINMSLGSPFGASDDMDPDVAASNNAAAVGIVVVASAGNSDDNSYVTGAPGVASGAISVAASEDGYSLLDGFEVTTPESLAGVHPGLQSVNYDWTSDELPVTGALVYPEPGDNPAQDQRTGCYPFNAANAALIDGNIVLLDWTEPSCGGSVTRSGNAVAAGAIGVLLVDDSEVFDLYIAGSAVVPAYSIPLPIGDALKTALGEGEVEVVMTAEHMGSVPYVEPAAEDIIASFSSRGPRSYDSALKPEVTAPGGSIFAAAIGTGTGGMSMGGTSMAAPHIAGVAALLKQAQPDWTPEEVKAALMNTAMDLKDGTPIPRSGAGRVDVVRAVQPDALAIGDEDLVSLSYGVLYSREDTVTQVKHVTVHDQTQGEPIDRIYDVGWAFQSGSGMAGADLTVEPAEIRMASGETAEVTVTLTVDYAGLPTGFGDIEEYYGFVTLTPVHYRLYLPIIVNGGTPAAPSSLQAVAAMGSNVLRVPFYFQPRPYALLDVVADTEIADPAADYGTITMTHQGQITSSLWIYPALMWNDTPDPTLAGPGDVRLFGLDYGGFSPYGDIIAVAINTWEPSTVPQPYFAEFDLYIDADEDGADDYVNFNWNYGAISTGVNDNTWVVVQVDLATGTLYLASPYLIYADYNASIQEWYLPAVWQDLGPDNSDFDYQLVAFEPFAAKAYPAGAFDYRKYPFDWMITNDPGPADDWALALVAVADVAGYYDLQPEGVMLVDYNGDPRNVDGGQAYFVPVTVTEYPAYLQVAHLAPFAMDPGTAVTVTLNGGVALTNVAYGDSTGYIPLPADEYLVEIFPGSSSTAAISATVDLEEATFYTAIATGDGVNQDLDLQALVDDLTMPSPGTAHLRMGHLAPFASGDATADIRLQDGTPVITDVVYSAITGFIPLPAGTYDLKITTPGGGTTLIDPLPVTFSAGQIVSVFATGDDSNQDLGVFALPPGAPGDFLPLATYVQVAHLAPFAEDASVTVRLNGLDALTEFGYGDSTDYITLPADEYLVEVVPTGTSTVAISATLDLEQATYYTAIATGDGTNQDLALQALVDDLTPPAAGKFHLRVGHLAPFAAGAATADVRLQDGTVVLDDVDFGDVTGFLPFDVGEYDLKITTPDGATTLIDPIPVTFTEGQIVSAFATGDNDNQDLGVFALPAGTPGGFVPLSAYLQVAHLAPFASDPGTAVTITLNSQVVLTNTAYGDSTAYLAVNPGEYLIEIFPGASTTAAISATVDLEEATYYTAIATGDGTNQPLALQALVDDLTPPAAGKFHLRVGHLAPFASGAATADVRFQDGTVVLDDVDFGDVTAFLPFDVGIYDLKITTPDGLTTLIDPLPVPFTDGQIVSAFATGDNSNQDLGVFALPAGAPGFFVPLAP